MEINGLLTDLNELILNFKDGLIAFIPRLILSIIVLGIGYLFGRLVKFLIIRLLNYLSRFLNQWFKKSVPYINFEGTAHFIGKLFFWLIFLSVFILVADILGLAMITDWMEGILQYSPNLLAAILIIVFAIFAGRMLSELIYTLSKNIGLSYGKTLGMIVKYLIIITAIIIAVDQVGIEISFLINVIDIILAALLFGASLAFGLGAKPVVSNILASFYVRKLYKVGDHIKIEEIQGKINRIEATAVLLDTNTEQVLIPAKVFIESKSFLIITD